MTQPEFHLEFPDGTLVDGETFESLARARFAALAAALAVRSPIIIRKSFAFFPTLLTEETVVPAGCAKIDTLFSWYPMACYEIQIFQDGGWTNDVSLLGHGLPQEANLWGVQEHAEKAIKELTQLWPELDGKLRVCLT